MSRCCDRRGSSRPSFACGSQRSNNNEGDLTQNVPPEVLRHLYMILLSEFPGVIIGSTYTNSLSQSLTQKRTSACFI